MKTINKQQAIKMIKSDGGRFFGVKFTKKDGTPRTMNCKRVMKAAIKGSYDKSKGKSKPSNDHVIPVYSNNDRGYRSFDIDRLISLKMGGEEYIVE